MRLRLFEHSWPSPPPKDCKGYSEDVEMHTVQGAREKALVEQRTRQRVWLKRKSADPTNPGDWRVRKRHRKAALQWIISLHNQLLPFPSRGLLHFPVAEHAGQRGDPRLRPRIAMTPDMGSDGVATK